MEVGKVVGEMTTSVTVSIIIFIYILYTYISHMCVLHLCVCVFIQGDMLRILALCGELEKDGFIE